jgi:hypothetical protein
MISKVIAPAVSRKTAADASQTSGSDVAHTQQLQQNLAVQAIRRDAEQQAGEYLRESVAPFGGE